MEDKRSEDDKNDAAGSPAPPPVRSRWILGTWSDLLLFVATPVLIIPVVALLQSERIGVTDRVLSTMVAAFGAMGHHLPGMIRAYGDRALFRRFKARFIISPLFLLAVCVPLAHANLSGMLVILLLWGLWHGLMQVYGFVRIYDARVGSNAPLTARLDWLMCLCWFVAGLLFSDGRMVALLKAWYSTGGPLIPPAAVDWARIAWGMLTLAVTALFFSNHFRLLREHRTNPEVAAPNPVKLLMLIGAICFWCYAMIGIRNVILGIALFEIFHDVQYLAIVWVYNRKRVEQSDTIGGFMRFLFRRSFAMVALYVGLVAVYGFIWLDGRYTDAQGLEATLAGLIWASTLLHFYFDGFIWKVREKSTRQGLGLEGGADAAQRWWNGEFGHLLKWSPFIALVVFMTIREDLNSEPPQAGSHERTWPSDIVLARQEHIAASVPGDLDSRTRLAVLLDEAGRTREAKRELDTIMISDSRFPDAWLIAGSIAQRHEELDDARRLLKGAIERYESSRRASVNTGRFANAHFRFGEVLLETGERDAAKESFAAALQLMPDYEPARAALEAIEQGR